MKLDRIDKLAVAALDHHLVPAKIRSSEEGKTFRHSVNLQAMILPNAQHTRLLRIMQETFSRAVDSAKDRILRVGNPDKAVLIFQWPIISLFVLLQAVKRHHASAKAQADQLMSAADCQDWDSVAANKLGECFNHSRVVI